MATLEQAIFELLAARDPGKTICPSEAARAVDPTGWRELMPEARTVSLSLAETGRVVITQGGEVVDPITLHGPWRLRLP